MNEKHLVFSPVDFNQPDLSNLTDSREKGIIPIGIIPNNSIIGAQEQICGRCFEHRYVCINKNGGKCEMYNNRGKVYQESEDRTKER